MKTTLHPDSRIGIIGAGGLGKEVLCCIADQLGWSDLASRVTFLVEDEYYPAAPVHGIEVRLLSSGTDAYTDIVVAIGNLEARKRIIHLLPSSTRYATIIDRSVQMTPYTTIGEGAIILANTFLSCDVHIGRFALINPATTISHDSRAGDFFTTSPGVNISGGCTIGHNVFLGTNACTRDAVTIADDVIIGMGAVVTSDILASGTYVGNPARVL